MTYDPDTPIPAYDPDGNLTPLMLEELAKPVASLTASDYRSVTLMLALIRCRGDLFIMLSDDRMSKWWQTIVGDARKRLDARRVAWRNYRLKAAAYHRLTGEERRALGIRKPTKPTTVDPTGIGVGDIRPLDDESQTVQV